MIPVDLIRDLGRKFPGAWKQLEAMRSGRGLVLPDWPAWCWCPLAASYAAITQGSDDRLPSGADVALLGAVASWRASQGIYRIHPALINELSDTPLDEVPSEWLYRIPEWCVFVEIEDGGFFAHLESDANNGHPELRLWVVPPDGDPQYPVILHLDKPTILDGIRSVYAEVERQRIASFMPSIPRPSVEVYAQTLRPLLNLLIYVIGAVQDGDCRNAKGGDRRPAKSSATPNHPDIWEIGWKQGALFAAAQDAASSQGGEHSGLRPHVRRAHWHHFWEGPRDGERNLTVRWLPPIFVGSGTIIPTIHDLERGNA